MYFAKGWEVYVTVYIILTLGYLWYRMILLFIEELKNPRKKKLDLYNNEKITILIPFFNEDLKILKKAIQSVINAKGNKNIVVIDDGSSNKISANMINKCFKHKVHFIRYEKNMGKREAHMIAYDKISGEFVITIDSDTIIERDSLINLILPMLKDNKIGATTGNIKVYNKNENMLTKMIASRYWNAFNIERKSLSSFGIVTCCSGVLSAYRSKIFKDILPSYAKQEFLGVKCTYGDDRHLTNLILKQNHKIIYVEDALCYTLVPNKYMDFFKQQLRWKKSFIRESLVSLRFAFKHSILLPVEILLNILIPLLSVLIRVSIIVSIIIEPFLLPLLISSIITVAVIRNLFLFFENKELAMYSIPYAFVHELVLFWIYIIAAATLRKNGWITR